MSQQAFKIAEKERVWTTCKTAWNGLRMQVDKFTMMSGDRVKIKDLLSSRLTECGWRDEVRLLCRSILQEKGAISSFTVEQLVTEVTPRARSLVPDAVKKELLIKIRTIFDDNEAEDNDHEDP